MKPTSRELAMWSALVALARQEVILDKVEQIIVGLDLERSHPMFMLWEQMGERVAKSLETWIDVYDIDGQRGEWLNDD